MSLTSESGAASAVRVALERVVDPCSIATGTAISLPEMGLIKDVREVGGGRVIVDLRLTSPFCFQIGLMLERIQEVTRGLAGVREVTVAVDHGEEWLPQMMSPAAQARLRRIRPAETVLTPPASGHTDPQSGER